MYRVHAGGPGPLQVHAARAAACCMHGFHERQNAVRLFGPYRTIYCFELCIWIVPVHLSILQVSCGHTRGMGRALPLTDTCPPPPQGVLTATAPVANAHGFYTVRVRNGAVAGAMSHDAGDDAVEEVRVVIGPLALSLDESSVPHFGAPYWQGSGFETQSGTAAGADEDEDTQST